jgi:cytoskeletal protein RodZ
LSTLRPTTPTLLTTSTTTVAVGTTLTTLTTSLSEVGSSLADAPSGLEPGVVAAIVIGVLLVIFGLAALLGWYAVRQRRQANKLQQDQLAKPVAAATPKPEEMSTKKRHSTKRRESKTSITGHAAQYASPDDAAAATEDVNNVLVGSKISKKPSHRRVAKGNSGRLYDVVQPEPVQKQHSHRKIAKGNSGRLYDVVQPEPVQKQHSHRKIAKGNSGRLYDVVEGNGAGHSHSRHAHAHSHHRVDSSAALKPLPAKQERVDESSSTSN